MKKPVLTFLATAIISLPVVGFGSTCPDASSLTGSSPPYTISLGPITLWHTSGGTAENFSPSQVQSAKFKQATLASSQSSSNILTCTYKISAGTFNLKTEMIVLSQTGSNWEKTGTGSKTYKCTKNRKACTFFLL
jgi:hypothetical protein